MSELLLHVYICVFFFMLGFFLGMDDANKGPREYFIMLFCSCVWPVILLIWIFEGVRECQ